MSQLQKKLSHPKDVGFTNVKSNGKRYSAFHNYWLAKNCIFYMPAVTDRCCNAKYENLPSAFQIVLRPTLSHSGHPKMKFFVTTIVLFIATMVFSSTGFAQIDFGIEEGALEDAVDDNPWSGSFAAGLNGKTGNSQNLDINATLNAVRETDINKTAFLASYFYAANDISTVTDRFFGQVRRERNLPNPRWTGFFQAQYEWDRFKSFDYRLALHGGLGFEVFKLEDGFLKLRFGAGASREFGVPDTEWLPELQFGGDWERQVTDTLKLFATSDYYPNVSDFAELSTGYQRRT